MYYSFANDDKFAEDPSSLGLAAALASLERRGL